MFNEENTGVSLTDEIMDALGEIEKGGTVQIGLSWKDAARMLPQVFTQFGTVKRNPVSLLGRGQKSAIERAMIAVGLQRKLEEEYLWCIEFDIPAGKIILCPELQEFIVSNDLVVDLATKGWNFRAK